MLWQSRQRNTLGGAADTAVATALDKLCSNFSQLQMVLEA